MARQTRQQRKERRQQQLADAAASQRGRPRQPAQARPAADAAPAPAAVETAPARRRGSFIAESWAELRKVEWPNQRQVIQGTVVVLIACFVVGFYLWGLDLVMKRFVQNVLLGQ